MLYKGSHESAAWLLMGLTGSTPGVLQIEHGRLIFTARGRGALTGGQLRELERRTERPGLAAALDEWAAETVLNVPLGAVGKPTFPWYSLSCAMNLTVGKQRYRFSFIQPQNTAGSPGAVGIPAARAAGRAWREVLGSVLAGG